MCVFKVVMALKGLSSETVMDSRKSKRVPFPFLVCGLVLVSAHLPLTLASLQPLPRDRTYNPLFRHSFTPSLPSARLTRQTTQDLFEEGALSPKWNTTHWGSSHPGCWSFLCIRHLLGLFPLSGRGFSRLNYLATGWKLLALLCQ